MAQVRIEAATQVKYKKNDNAPYIGVLIKGKWFNVEWPVNIDPRTLKNKTLDLEFQTNNNWAKLAGAPNAQFAAQPPAGFSQIGPILDKVAPQVQSAPQPTLNQAPVAPMERFQPIPKDDRTPWADMVTLIRAAHNLAMELEPMGVEAAAQARLALVNTLVIAFGQGKVTLPLEEILGEDPQLDGVGDPDEIRY